MDKLLTAEQLRLFWLFAMPGIIILYVRAQFLAGKMPALSEGIIAYLVVSIGYHALLFPVAAPFYGTPAIGLVGGALWFVYTLIGPILVGLLLGLNIRGGWLKAALAKVGVNTVHAIDAAWDWRFSNCADCFVTITLKNETRWRGYVGDRSFMSSNSTERDIFIEKVYTLGENDDWYPRDSGVWIAHGEIQTIEFWPNNRVKHDEGQQSDARE